MPADLHRHRLGVLRALMARIELINASIGHNLTQGEENEDAVRSLLTSVLPQAFGIGSGVIVGVDGVASKQIDIIVYDKTRANLTLGSDSRLFFADQVLMAIEIKTTFTSGGSSSLASALENIASVKRLGVASHEWVEPRLEADGSYSIVHYKPSPPLGLVLFFSTPETSGPLDLDAFFTALRGAIGGIPLGEQPDLLVSLGHASYFRHFDIGAHTESTQQYSSVLVQDESDKSKVLGLDPSAGALKSFLDIGRTGLSAGAVNGVQISNDAKTSTVQVVGGKVLHEEPTVYRVARAGKTLYLLDKPRAFLIVVEAIEKLLKAKRPNPMWAASDYFGQHWPKSSAYPNEFQNF